MQNNMTFKHNVPRLVVMEIFAPNLGDNADEFSTLYRLKEASQPNPGLIFFIQKTWNLFGFKSVL